MPKKYKTVVFNVGNLFTLKVSGGSFKKMINSFFIRADSSFKNVTKEYIRIPKL